MIGSTVNSATYAGNGSTSTAYVIPFRYDASSWVKVTVTNALGEIEDLEQVTDYTLAGTGSTANGTFTTIAAISSTSTVSVYREAPGTQTLSLPANTALPAVALEAQMDRLAMAAADSVSKRELAAQLSALLIEAGVNITTEDLLALLAGETLEPGTLTLPDFEDSTPPANALGLAGGRLALGDGATVAGNPLTPRRVAGMVICDLNGTNKTSARFAVVGIPLTAAEVVAGAAVQISGTVKLLFDDVFYITEDPVISATIGFAHAAYKTDTATKWLSYNSLPTGTEIPYLISHEIAGDFQLSTNATPGPNKVVLSFREPKITSDRWAGAAGNTFTKNASSIFFVNPSDTSVAVTEETADVIWLSVEIVMGASGTNLDINFAVVYDLDTAVTLP